MPRNWSKAVPEGNNPISHQEELEFDQPTPLAGLYRMTEELFDKPDRELDELTDKMRATKQRLVGLEQSARQLRLAMEADESSVMKTRERTEGAAAAAQAKNRDSCFANSVQGNRMGLTSFGDDFTGPPAFPCTKDKALADKGAATPKPCLSSVKMHSRTATGGLLPAGKASTTTKII